MELLFFFLVSNNQSSKKFAAVHKVNLTCKNEDLV